MISQLKPEPRTDIIKLLAQKQKLPTAMIDLSDELASDILYSLPTAACTSSPIPNNRECLLENQVNTNSKNLRVKTLM